jgi:hypothetical protein
MQQKKEGSDTVLESNKIIAWLHNGPLDFMVSEREDFF